MNKVSRTLSGIGLLIFGFLMLIGARTAEEDWFSIVWIGGWGLLLIGLAVYLFMNKDEDKIEEIKNEDK